jgi:uncharacterized membrane protein YgcG
MRTFVVAAGAFVAVLVVVFGVGPAGARAWADPGEAVTAFDAVVVVGAAGDLQVTETIRYRFAGTGHHGLLRELHSSQVTALRAESPSGAPAGSTVTASGGYTTIRVGDPTRTVSGTQTYVLRYTLGGVFDADALRWDFVGDGWQVPVQRAAVRITAPRPADTRHCAAPGCTITASATTAVVTAGPLAPGDGLPVTLDYPAGTVRGTASGPSVLGWLQLVAVLGVLGGLGWLGARVLRNAQDGPSGAHRAAVAAVPVAAPGEGSARFAVPPGRDRREPGVREEPRQPSRAAPGPGPASAGPAVPLAEAGLPAPPSDISPGLLGILHTGGRGTDPVTATLLDLAVRGYLRVEEQAGRRRARDWTLVATAPTTPDRLPPHEEALLHSAFGGRPTVTITALCHRRTRALVAAHKALVAEAVDRGWVTKNVVATAGKAVGTGIVLLGFAAAVLNMTILSFPRSFPSFFLGIGAGIVGVLVTALFALARPVRRTAAGDAVLAELAPYRAELAGAGLDRIPPERAAEVFSRSLPYAAALGLAYGWTRRFADLFAMAPRGAAGWYAPAGPWTTGLGAVTGNVVGFVTAAGARPSASTSGGFSSSGSSGSSSMSFSGGGDSGGSSSGGGGSW